MGTEGSLLATVALMKQLFTIPSKEHGPGKVLFAWQKEGTYLATAGSNGGATAKGRRGGHCVLIDVLGQPRLPPARCGGGGAAYAPFHSAKQHMTYTLQFAAACGRVRGGRTCWLVAVFKMGIRPCNRARRGPVCARAALHVYTIEIMMWMRA